jgi:hypothetical protein
MRVIHPWRQFPHSDLYSTPRLTTARAKAKKTDRCGDEPVARAEFFPKIG